MKYISENFDGELPPTPPPGIGLPKNSIQSRSGSWMFVS